MIIKHCRSTVCTRVLPTEEKEERLGASALALVVVPILSILSPGRSVLGSHLSRLPSFFRHTVLQLQGFAPGPNNKLALAVWFLFSHPLFC